VRPVSEIVAVSPHPQVQAPKLCFFSGPWAHNRPLLRHDFDQIIHLLFAPCFDRLAFQGSFAEHISEDSIALHREPLLFTAMAHLLGGDRLSGLRTQR